MSIFNGPCAANTPYYMPVQSAFKSPVFSAACSAEYYDQNVAFGLKACSVGNGINTIRQTLAASALSHPSCSGKVSRSVDSNSKGNNRSDSASTSSVHNAGRFRRPSVFRVSSVLDDLPRTANIKRSTFLPERSCLAALVSPPFLRAFDRPLRKDQYNLDSQPSSQAAFPITINIMAHQEYATSRHFLSVGHRHSGDERFMKDFYVSDFGDSVNLTLEAGGPAPGRPPD